MSDLAAVVLFLFAAAVTALAVLWVAIDATTDREPVRGEFWRHVARGLRLVGREIWRVLVFLAVYLGVKGKR